MSWMTRAIAMRSAAVLLLFTLGCAAAAPEPEPGRLRFRPGGTGGVCEAGTMRLDVQGPRDSILFVPRTTQKRMPLLVLLHGAGGSPERILQILRPFAEKRGIAILAPASIGSTWDSIRGDPGADVAAIDEALAEASKRCAFAPLAIGGFSDGASYALHLGVLNGDVFPVVLAFSPCARIPAARHGRPRIFLSHGRRDDILPFQECGQAIAGQLQRSGFDVRFEPFDGTHMLPPTLDDALRWWLR